MTTTEPEAIALKIVPPVDDATLVAKAESDRLAEIARKERQAEQEAYDTERKRVFAEQRAERIRARMTKEAAAEELQKLEDRERIAWAACNTKLAERDAFESLWLSEYRHLSESWSSLYARTIKLKAFLA